MPGTIEDSLHVGQQAYIEAPAGYGKTHLILTTIAKYPGSRQLVLTHTIAGVAALRSRLNEHGLGDENVSITTIAGWAQRYVRAYPSLAGVDLDGLDAMNVGDYWSAIYDAFQRLIRKSNIADIIKANFDGIYVDEYQDCSIRQHELIVSLADLLPVRILGDPLQGIFDFNHDMVPWADVQSAFSHIATLETPHRWINAGNEEYGQWLALVRESLQAGTPIDLTQAPGCVEVVLLTGNNVEDIKKCLSKASETLKAGRRRLVIGDKQNNVSKSLIKSMSRPRYVLIESLDSKDVRDIKAFAALMDARQKDGDLLFVDVLDKCFTGLGVVKAAAARMKTDSSYAPRQPLYMALAQLRNRFNPELALRVIKALEKANGVSCHRHQLVSILEIALTGLAAGTYQDFASAIRLSVESIRQKGRHLPRYSVGSTLLVKGLQVEEVVLMNAHALGRRDLYVALTRPTLRIVIFTDRVILTPE